MKRGIRRVTFVAVMFACIPEAFAQQSFSCSMGEPACLDYGAVVCKSNATCVAKDAVCFDSYACDYKGFICKSKFDDAVREIDDKVNQFNSLLVNFNALKLDFNTFADCVSRATTLEEAKSCRT